MATPLNDLPAGVKVPDEIFAVIEVPKGSHVRYEYDVAIAAFRLVAPVRSGVWPADYGFIPSTISEDGFPIDAVVLGDAPTFPGCVVACRPVGVLHLTDGRRPDHKVICIPLVANRYSSVQDLPDVPEALRDEITRFFAENPLISGTEERVDGWEGAEAARDVVFRAWEGFLL